MLKNKVSLFSVSSLITLIIVSILYSQIFGPALSSAGIRLEHLVSGTVTRDQTKAFTVALANNLQRFTVDIVESINKSELSPEKILSQKQAEPAE